ncbi:MAG: DUF3291 domain-containing protein [Blastocatellia bacterium]|nr:DUF3291 domain-containing protein [Blastocatellia bacterium]
MKSQGYHLAQVNIARMLAPIDSPIMADFVALLDEINALADNSPGFVWRLQTEKGDATDLCPYEDNRILVNLSVWQSVEDLKNYVYKSAHSGVMKRRKEWFEKFDGMYMALWWIEAGHIPTVNEAKEKLDYLSKYGESPLAFTFKRLFAPELATSPITQQFFPKGEE